MTAQLAPQPVFQAFAPNGGFLVGGKLFTYAAGTSTPQATYIDSTQTTQNTNPVILNAMGQANIWLNPTLSYKFVLQDSAGNPLWSVDSINAPTLTQAIIGQLLYPQTAAEITAAIVPLNYAYPPLNVLRYGATGNGLTDDWSPIQSAINVAKVSGGVVYLPPGNYRISAILAVGDSNSVYIAGAGLALTSISPTTSVTTAVTFGVSGATNQGIYNLSILCGNATSCVGLSVNNLNGFAATNFLIQQASTGLQIIGGVIHFYSDFQINRCINFGISVNGGNDQFFDNGVLSSVGFTQPMAGINILGNNGGVWLSNVDAISQGVGLLINPTSGQSVQWLFAINCAFDTNSNNGINISPSGTGSVYGAAFTGCWSASNTNAGFVVGANTGTVNGVQVVNHRSFNNGLGGYTVSASAGTTTNVSFDACVASGNSQTTPNTNSGFEIGAAISGWSIRNSRSGQAENFGVTQAHGIIVNAGASNNYQMVGNDVRGNSALAILDAGTGTTKMVSNNLGSLPLGSAAITVTASPFSFANNTGAPIAVMVTGGTVSAITIETQGTGGIVAGQFIVPQGAAIVVTYTVAPAMVYFGL